MIRPCPAAAVVIAFSCAVSSSRAEAEPPTPEQIESWVNDLRDDDIHFNAERALDELVSAGDAAIPSLEEAVRSADRQQRKFAAYVLAQSETYEPSDAMLAALVEGLADDEMPKNSERGYKGHDSTYNYCFNASRGTEFLLDHAERAERHLIVALTSSDAQQRFLAAYILGANGRTAAAPLIAQILIPHLRDNEVAHDASMACYALYHLGDVVRPMLRDALEGADAQQLELINLILLDLEDPPSTQEELVERGRMFNVRSLVHDPAIQFYFREFRGVR